MLLKRLASVNCLGIPYLRAGGSAIFVPYQTFVGRKVALGGQEASFVEIPPVYGGYLARQGSFMESPSRKVEVMPHSPGWAAAFLAEADRLTAVLDEEVVAVHHIGSTAIPGISAKPLIDLLLEVREVERLDDFGPEMVGLGYVAWGEFGLPGRRFFVKAVDGRRTHHVHAYTTGDPELERHLAFRDYMISHPEDALAYSRLKERLAKEYPTDIEGYMDGKDAFIGEMERKALEWSRRQR